MPCIRYRRYRHVKKPFGIYKYCFVHVWRLAGGGGTHVVPTRSSSSSPRPHPLAMPNPREKHAYFKVCIFIDSALLLIPGPDTHLPLNVFSEVPAHIDTYRRQLTCMNTVSCISGGWRLGQNPSGDFAPELRSACDFAWCPPPPALYPLQL